MRIETRKGALAFISALFFGIGLPATVIGPALPELAASTGSTLAEVGALFSVLFLGALITQAGSGFLIDRLGERPIIGAGVVVGGLGVFGIGTAISLPVVLGGAFLMGAGNGAVLAAANIYIARVFARGSLSALNLVNLCYGIGAVTGPALAGLAIELWDAALPMLFAGGIFYLAFAPFVPLLRVKINEPVPEEKRSAAGGSVYRSPLLWATGALLLLYVGTEAGYGGWSATYIDRTTPLDLGAAALVTSGYWLALSVGRGLGALLGRWLSPERLLTFSLTGASSGAFLLAASTGNALLSVAATLLLGLSFGPVFPTAFSITTSTFKSAPGKAVSVILSMGSTGGMLLPWLQGTMMEQVGPNALVLLVASGVLAMLLLYAGTRLVAGRKTVRTSTTQVLGTLRES